MRRSHLATPYHRIACWTGKYFRDAALWEVGVYLTVPHREAPCICPNLQWQQDTLERFQKQRDYEDKSRREPTFTSSVFPEDHVELMPEPVPDSVPESGDEAMQDAALMQCLDQLLQGHNIEDLLEEDENNSHRDTEEDVMDLDAGATGFVGYMGSTTQPDTGPGYDQLDGSEPCIPVPPQQDALNNQYVRIVHINGIHHIALVSCSCKGHENMIMDLIYAQLIPTSFDRIRTLFTSAVLDHFRYCNLEMKSSAYQFFQLLRRITMPMNPSRVVNLYHELRRLSRLWRWTKKLRWAGYAQQPDQPIKPDQGELANFCPACPQVGINVAANWLQDPNRWVYRRVSTVDGNFKANHVRQKQSAEDIWLYDGLGMTARRPEYESFIKTAQEQTSMSRARLIALGIGR
jgi:hypothetical protein